MVGISLHVYDVREIQNSLQKILKEEIFIIPAEARFDDQTFISTAEKTHHIAGAIGIIEALEDHLILRKIFCIPYNLREYKHAFPLKLLQCFICYFSC